VCCVFALVAFFIVAVILEKNIAILATKLAILAANIAKMAKCCLMATMLPKWQKNVA
jgi:hypothetical protein